MKNKTWIMLIVLAAMLVSCRQTSPEIVWPTIAAEASDPDELTIAPDLGEAVPVIEAVPDFSAWEIGEAVSPEQQIYLNRLVEFAWYSYFSPYSRPDCGALLDVFSSGNPWNETVGLHCDLMAEQGYYVMFPILPEHAISYFSFPERPNGIAFVIRVDSLAPWVADVRYFGDGAQMGYMSYMRTIIDFHLTIEDGRLLIGLIDEFYLDEEGGVWDRGESGDLVKVERF